MDSSDSVTSANPPLSSSGSLAINVTPRVSPIQIPERLVDGIKEHLENSSSSNTLRAYRSDWASFDRWCATNSLESLPADPAVVAAYLTDKAGEVKPDGSPRYAPSSLSRWVTAINYRHQEFDLIPPGSSPAVKRVLSGIRRSSTRRTRRVAPLLLDDLRKTLTQIDIQSFPTGVIGRRDAALLVLGFAGAFRRSELATRTFADMSIHAEDGLHVRLHKSKTDQEGRGSIKGLPYGQNPLTCPPCAFLRWVRVLAAHETGVRSDLMRVLFNTHMNEHICRAPAPELEQFSPSAPVFRTVRNGGLIGDAPISGEVVNFVLKNRLSAAGYDPKRFGAHSLRAGFVTQAFRSGATSSEVMRQTGHTNPATVEIYRRENDPLRDNAVTRVGL